MSLRQVDSLIRFVEQVKSLRDMKVATDSLLVVERLRLQNEKETRRREMQNYQSIINGFAAIEQGKNNEIAMLKKKYKGQVRKNRFLIIVTVGALGWGVYQTIK